MYFKNRKEAGQKLAEQLLKYVDDKVVVVAINSGGVEVGEVVAELLRCQMTLLLSREIEIPGEDQIIGTVDQSGEFVYNSSFSDGQIDEYMSEFHGVIESEKMNKASEVNRVLGNRAPFQRNELRDKIVILVADGVLKSTSLDAAMNFLKPVAIMKLVIATPLATVPAVDRMHIVADEIHILSVQESFVDVDHYFNGESGDSPEQAKKRLEKFQKNFS